MRVNTRCRICKGDRLTKVIDLGFTPLANAFLTREDLHKAEKRYPLRIFFCNNCNLLQLIDVVSPKVLFRNYVYFSSGMPVLPEHFKNYAEEVKRDLLTSKGDLVVEIGSNDGLLLGAIKNLGAKVLGVDPAVNIARIANKRGVKTLPDFFTRKLAKDIVKKYGHAKVVIGNNVVAHIDNHHDLVSGISTLLTDNGIFIFEAPYLVDMFENLTFDTIYHEHLSYLAVRPLKQLFDQYDMEIIDVKTFPVQGNSLRVYAAKKGMHKIKSSVKKFLEKEKKMKLDKGDTYLRLADRIAKLRRDVVRVLIRLKGEGKRIAAYGAPAKGNTLLNYFDIGSGVLDYATEGLPSKVGLYTPGAHIPVVHINEARENPPDYYLLLAWNYKDAVLEKEKEFRKRGGKFILPVGKVEII